MTGLTWKNICNSQHKILQPQPNVIKCRSIPLSLCGLVILHTSDSSHKNDNMQLFMAVIMLWRNVASTIFSLQGPFNIIFISVFGKKNKNKTAWSLLGLIKCTLSTWLYKTPHYINISNHGGNWNISCNLDFSFVFKLGK